MSYTRKFHLQYGGLFCDWGKRGSAQRTPGSPIEIAVCLSHGRPQWRPARVGLELPATTFVKNCLRKTLGLKSHTTWRYHRSMQHAVTSPNDCPGQKQMLVMISNFYTFTFSQALHYINWIYARTKKGQEFKQHCDYVHTFADEIIKKRQHQLVGDVFLGLCNREIHLFLSFCDL